MGLAVGNHFFVRGDAQVLEDLRHVGTNAQAAAFIHAGGPFEVFRARDVPAFGRQHFFTGVFGGAARIPNCQVSRAQAALQVLAGGSGGVVQRQRQRATDCRRHSARHRATFRDPGVNAAIQIVVSLVSDHVEQPDKAAGPTAAFVVIHHVDRVGVVPQFAEQRLQRSLARQ